ncbi:component of SufBCD complex [Pseudooceanicola nitratireducens]|uniref:Component of SufBCD complex n=1 Tax=Pseudooceanicola nitratireducens TaxID=517719 RepID=A0A1I1LHL3_9RHOB|nr:component of SufBCD complex [Pseudooceanicola nitratireducens]MEC7299521.1 component of SufBCD complex [Pseudomonadota bacterium]MBY6157351.1 component of SufBCD complex [Pseudooceanicola nitratireducens]MBY6165827.1 component of SufBCD complex [Pseudooceanicola nitratireducens]MEC7793045.1 component of SufBCD complex [Pseudomonadota bacterium]MEC8666656.1 component of SufBCD complex [Pseudomonadota bacterium]
MDLADTIFEVIDMRSFSNLWFWIALAVVWSTASHWVLGVPWDLVTRAKRRGGSAAEDVEDLCRVYVRRILHVAEVSGLVMTVLACFVLTSLAVLGFGYSIEFAQAVFLLAFPMTLVGLLSLRSARIIRAEDPTGHELYRRLQIHRMSVQFIGMASIFVTTMWGMFKNFSLGVLGG